MAFEVCKHPDWELIEVNRVITQDVERIDQKQARIIFDIQCKTRCLHCSLVDYGEFTRAIILEFDLRGIKPVGESDIEPT